MFLGEKPVGGSRFPLGNGQMLHKQKLRSVRDSSLGVASKKALTCECFPGDSTIIRDVMWDMMLYGVCTM